MPAMYARHRPETTDLYKLVQRHYRTFASTMDEAGRSLPKYVLREFAVDVLTCGRCGAGTMQRIAVGDLRNFMSCMAGDAVVRAPRRFRV